MRPDRVSRWLAAVLLGWALALLAVDGARAQFTRFENLTDEQGLGNASVSAIAQDRDGYVLLGTEAGLYRYDGTGVAPVDAGAGLPADAWIRSMSVDTRGRLWVATPDTLYVRRERRFVAVDTGSTLRLASPHVLAMLAERVVVDDRGRLIAATLDGSGAGRFTPLPGLEAAGPMRFVVADGPAALLAGCGTALCRVEGGRVSVIGKAAGLPADAWQVARRGPDGTLWARSLDRLAWRRPGDASFQVVPVPGERGWFNITVPSRLDLAVDGRGRVLTQGEEGLLAFDGTGWRALRNHEGGLSASPVEALMFDREGSLWVGSAAHGAFHSIGWGHWEHWTAEDGLPSDIVWSMTRPAGGPLWVATYADAVALDGHGQSVRGGSENVSATRSGRLWFAPMRAPLARLDRTGGPLDRVPIEGLVASTLLDRANRFWVATNKGLRLVEDADAPAALLRTTLALARPVLQAAEDPAGRIWAVTAETLYRRGEDGRFSPVDAPLPAGQQAVGLAFGPDGMAWVMTDGAGIAQFRVDGDRLRPAGMVAAPVIGSNNILFVLRDRRGWMWVGTDHGVDVSDGRRWRHYDASDGLISNDLDQWAAFEDRDGSMWFGTSHGLSHLLDPTHVPAVGALHPLITKVAMGERMLPVASSLRIAWSSAPLVIHFVDLDFARGRNIGFRYRLDGVDTGWTETAAHEVRYASLPAGRFRFELMSVDGAHRAVSASTGFTLRVRAPWWRRWWFCALCVLLTVAAVAAAWQTRVRLLVRQQRRLERVVSARTAEIEQARIELQRLAMSDGLTGLANRRAVMAALEEAVPAALRSGEPLAVLLCDIDHFRKINDGFGHLAGDAVLAEFGVRLKVALRGAEMAGRYGGEEFCIVLPRAPESVAERVASIRSAVSDAPFTFGHGSRTVTSSGGLAFLREGDSALSLLTRADHAMFRAKQEGRNRVEYERDGANDAAGTEDGPQCSASSRRAELERDLRLALAEGQFSLHYQPVADVRRGVVTSWEALLRWQSPTRGRVPPAEFIPFAEQVGLMPEISDWVLRKACREAAGWPARVGISVNLSAVQFRMPDMVARVEAALAQSGLAATRLELEVTETAMITEAAVASAMLDKLRLRGIKVALDDFGTGYSSLSFLRTLPFDRIKIDRSFVQDLGIKPEAAVIVRAIAGMCESLGAAVTAEGVETDGQVEALRAAGCEELQGYRISRPMPAGEVRAWAEAFEGRVWGQHVQKPLEVAGA